jgi:S-adenosylmethionine-dependent methyltransferase
MAESERPEQHRSFVRTAVVWDELQGLLDGATTTQRVLDIGGGTGGFAVRIAALGHQVTVMDPSPDALAAADRRAHESGVADRVTGVQGDLGDLASGQLDHDLGDVDLVLCHEVFGLVENHRAALDAISDVLRAGGALSLLVRQRHAAVLNHALAGQFQQAQLLLDDPEAGRERRFTADEVQKLLGEAGYGLRSLRAVRVFADLVPAELVDGEPGAAAALVELERAASKHPAYLTLASRIHTISIR